MASSFVQKIESLTPEQRLHFYELLAHNLTVSIRAIWLDSEIDDTEKVDQIKWVNEVAHRITAKIHVLRLNTHEWTEADIWQLFKGAVQQNSSIERHLASAIGRSFDSVTAKRD